MPSEPPTTNSAFPQGDPFPALAGTMGKNNNTSVQQTNSTTKSVTFATKSVAFASTDNDTINTPVAGESTDNTTNERE